MQANAPLIARHLTGRMVSFAMFAAHPEGRELLLQLCLELLSEPAISDVVHAGKRHQREEADHPRAASAQKATTHLSANLRAPITAGEGLTTSDSWAILHA